MALLRSIATVGGFTAISRVLGFVRDVLIADVLGTGPVADAFFVAFRLPNLFRRLFAEGAFNAAFVPLFSRRLEQTGAVAAKVFAEQALSVLLFTLFAFTALAMAAMPWLMQGLAPGFSVEPAKFEMAVNFSRITFPYLLFMSLVALFSGVLNALYRFAAAAAAPILLNIFFILSLTLVIPLVGQAGEILAWTVVAAGIGQFLLLAVAASRAGMALRLPRPRITPGLRRLGKLMVPGILSAGVLQLNLLVGTIIASLQAGAVSYLYYADRVYQLPLGLIGIAFGIVLLPDLSRKLRSGQQAAALDSLNRGLEFALLLTLPATVALLVIPWPIVMVLFERGAFDRDASDATAMALAAFAAGLPAFVLVKILQPAFFAEEDTVMPLKLAAISVLVNMVLSIALFWQVGFVGIAIATSVAAWVNTCLLALVLKRRGFFVLDDRFRSRLPRIALASLLMAPLLWGGHLLLADWFAGGLVLKVSALALLVTVGLLFYLVLALILRAMEPAEVLRLLRGRR